MPWLIVLNDQAAAAWVLKHKRMAFRNRAGPDLQPGERMAVYLTRGAFHNPTRGRSLIVALGYIDSSVVAEPIIVAGQTYDRSCALTFDSQAPLNDGLPFSQLVEKLQFIDKKDAWGAYLRRTFVRLSDEDFAVIQSAFVQFQATSKR
jgi:hypothetical protein